MKARIFKEWLADNTNIIADGMDEYRLTLLRDIIELELGRRIEVIVKEVD